MYGFVPTCCCNHSGYNDGFGASWIWIIIIVFILFFIFGGFNSRGYYNN